MKTHIFIISIAVLIFSCREKIKTEPIVENHKHPHTHTSLGTPDFPKMPIPIDNETSMEGIALGRKLFYDKSLSGDETQSCGSCHQQSRAFSDNKRFSVGIDGVAGKSYEFGFSKKITDAFSWKGKWEGLENHNAKNSHKIEIKTKWKF